CTWNSGMNWRQKLFLAWIAPRGIVSASVASLFSILLTERGLNGGDAIKALVFLTIILTVFMQGLTARWVASLLKLNSKEAKGAVIIGCNALSLLVARLFQERGEPVVFIDTDPEASQLADTENLPIYISSGLDTEVLEKAGLDSVGTFLAMTNNGEVNLVLAQRAAEEFQPPAVLAVFPRDPESSPVANTLKVSQAFASGFSIKTWNQYLNDRAVKLGELVFATDPDAQQTHVQKFVDEGELLPLLVERDQHLRVAPAMEEWQAGDRLIYLLHDPKPKLLKLLSGSALPRLVPERLLELEVPVTDPPIEVTISVPAMEDDDSETEEAIGPLEEPEITVGPE
ncbi:MAG: NAD-binding protein, partial [Leptolyngbyaceae cyanobacterium bins.59]|nr:NAD-binding protein [Leptolyngbyaceae cyanobacterium bins.59]